MNHIVTLRRIIRRYYAENGPLLAKGLSYNFLLGLLPLLFLVFWTAAMLIHLAPGLQEVLEEEILTYLPAQMAEIVRYQIAYLGRAKGAIGTLTAGIFSVTVFFLFESLERIIRTMHGGKARPWLRARLISAGMVLASLLLVYASAILSLGIRIFHEYVGFGGDLLPLAARSLAVVLTSLFFALCQIVYSGTPLRVIPLLIISFTASGIWHVTAYMAGLLIRYAGRRFIVYGALATAVSYTIFLRVFAEIIIFSTLLVRYYSSLRTFDEVKAPDTSQRDKKRPPDV
ncbi:YhjD/YihY/BrkB family envelope integrity protein [Marispirochaeta aestuarii]|uniref:YhjD/YihY/BrkB family envelope integrity protein n=1 Tax=Marispirochaeta aestuarii TaxID=1963862 RepID=UPI0029C8E1C0|nr:YhjD/YihY/BrkB family envelope integrity protein [Marispirochaeta aestuarii]